MISTTRIRSENDLFQTFVALRGNRSKRNKRGEFIFEGVRNINNAQAFNWQMRGLLFAPERPLSAWARGVLTACDAAHRYELPMDLLAKLSAKETPSELLGIAAIPPDDLMRIGVQRPSLVLVFDRPANPGNLGTLIRSCDALGADGLVVSGHAVDVYDAETISAATGSLFSLPVVRVPSQRELEPWLATLRAAQPTLQVIGTDESAEVRLDACDFTRPTVLLVGNEARGLSVGYKALCDAMVRIPMLATARQRMTASGSARRRSGDQEPAPPGALAKGSASSLNVACAGSIVLYEIARQRQGAA